MVSKLEKGGQFPSVIVNPQQSQESHPVQPNPQYSYQTPAPQANKF
jgi:hypothetical protein